MIRVVVKFLANLNPQDLKNGPPIPHFALYGLKMGLFGPLFASPRSCGPCGPIVTPLDTRHKIYGENNWFLVKIEKISSCFERWKSLATGQKRSLFALECSKMRCRLELRSRPRWGSLQRSPDPLAVEGEGRGAVSVSCPRAHGDPSYASGSSWNCLIEYADSPYKSNCSIETQLQTTMRWLPNNKHAKWKTYHIICTVLVWSESGWWSVVQTTFPTPRVVIESSARSCLDWTYIQENTVSYWCPSESRRERPWHREWIQSRSKMDSKEFFGM